MAFHNVQAIRAKFSNLRLASFSAPKRDSQKRVREPCNDSRESGDPRESANRFARIGPSKVVTEHTESRLSQQRLVYSGLVCVCCNIPTDEPDCGTALR